MLEGEHTLAQTRPWLSDRQNPRWLLILDNHDDPDQYQIEQYCPYVSHGAIIITTRRLDLVAGTELRMQSLQSVEDSLEILESRSRRKNIQSVPSCAAARAAARAAPRWSSPGPWPPPEISSPKHHHLREYLQEYEQRWNIDPRRTLELQEYRDRTLFTTWVLQYARLESQGPDAAKLLRLLAYFDHQRLWYELFRAGVSDESPEWLPNVVASYIDFESVMRRLTNYCFIEVQTSQKSWSIHGCLHDWTFAALNKDVDEEQYWYVFDCVGARSLVDVI
ncbi:hypothetical protein LTR70_009280 [Exophiala xenobiotica]|uniref:NB-ARC domain-containing protein n=1 Tax=Lithohypha guttulata TaxID=1690604 RepID=A0ABR0JYP5_9EURO|nr:hypothetical protein LTR24_009132 [Lithohypha guttulata]KAK5310713.1 hypothetical protein LTR70_009280 [Exophiala xenobiotica]